MGKAPLKGVFFSIVCLAAIVGGVFIGAFFCGSGVSDNVSKGRALRCAKIRRGESPKGAKSNKFTLRVKEGEVARPFSIEDIPEAFQFKTDSDKEEIVSVIAELSDFLKTEDTKKVSEEIRGVSVLREALEANDARRVAGCLQAMAKSRNKYVREVAAVAANWLASNAVGASGLAELAGLIGGTAGGGTTGVGGAQGGGAAGGNGGDAGVSDGEGADEGTELSREELAQEMKEFLKEQQSLTEWDEKLNECGTEASRIALAQSSLQASSDENACNYYASVLINSSDKAAAVRAIVNLSASGSEACQKAVQDAYSWITDEPWSGQGAAQAWLSAHGE